MNEKVLLVDMDGTLADLTGAVLDSDGNFHLTAMLEILKNEQTFINLKPFNNMVDAIRMIIVNHPEIEVKILSTAQKDDPPGIPRQKNIWLDKVLPELDKKNRLFVAPEVSKNKILESIGSDKEVYLIDDYNKNLVEFEEKGGHSIKCRNYYNGQGRGAYGGDFGNVWDKKIKDIDAVVYTTDNSEKIYSDIEKLLDVRHISPDFEKHTQNVHNI